MKLNEFILKLEKFKEAHGDLEVLITDGYKANCYKGNYEFNLYQDNNNQWCLDIGIGGLLE
jgi:hypothetical protein